MNQLNKLLNLTGVYYVFCPDDQTVLLARDIVVSPERKTITWFDTIKDRVMHYREISDSDPNHFVFEREQRTGRAVYTFVPLTLDIYNEIVKYHIIVPRTFSSAEEMIEAFEETKKNAW